ncbi:hypothetical protein V5799_003981 [Amblyomma americanum]|uniref:Nlr family card domain protein n=1 Tax=Amblyomma americanum TaxID=6943 RepID=A0AAQ4D7E7_AMBAM
MYRWGVFELPVFLSLFCDGLRQCHRLRSLTLCVDSLFQSERRRLLDAMSNLHHIEEFSYDRLDVSDKGVSMSDLRDFIMSNAKLNRLQVQRFDAVPTSLWYVLRLLATNARLSDLCLDVSCLPASECGLFSLALQEHRTLKSLRLVGSLRRPTLSVAAVAQAVESATALSTLELSYFHFTIGDAWALVTSLACTKSVQQLALFACVPIYSHLAGGPCSSDSGRGAFWHMHPFVHMLRKVTSLRKLTFPLASYPPDDQRTFLGALRANDSVEEMHVDRLNNRNFSEFCRLICETCTASRVRIGTARAIDETRLDIASAGSHTGDVSVLAEGMLRRVEMHRWFTQLSTLSGLTTLTIDVASTIDAESAALFAQYLRNTQLLNDVKMSFFALRHEALVLLNALSHNSSITALAVEYWCRSKRTARIMTDVVCSSKKILTLAYHLACRNPPPAFFPALAQDIESNCTILSVKTFPLMSVTKHWNRIQEVVARNHSLLVRAAQYVTGCAVLKSGAEALELLGSNRMLVSKVQEMASVGETEARDVIRSRLADLDDLDFFMSVAGVVRERVACEESAEGRACLETLPYDCWWSLRRYLRVADIIDGPQERQNKHH